jgi:uncharacterized oligopeptide transporter (OPT) family protein
MADQQSSFRPFVSPETNMAEFTIKSVLTGAVFGIIFGAATVYLALKAGLTVSASIPIAVMAIALSKLFLRTTILFKQPAPPGKALPRGLYSLFLAFCF